MRCAIACLLYRLWMVIVLFPFRCSLRVFSFTALSLPYLRQILTVSRRLFCWFFINFIFTEDCIFCYISLRSLLPLFIFGYFLQKIVFKNWLSRCKFMLFLEQLPNFSVHWRLNYAPQHKLYTDVTFNFGGRFECLSVTKL